MTDTDESLLAGTRQVAVEPLPEEAHLAFHLLESAGMHPILAYQDDSGEPHPIDPEAPFTLGGGLMVPLTTTFAVYVPEAEEPDAQRVLQYAGRALPAIRQSRGRPRTTAAQDPPVPKALTRTEETGSRRALPTTKSRPRSGSGSTSPAIGGMKPRRIEHAAARRAQAEALPDSPTAPFTEVTGTRRAA